VKRLSEEIKQKEEEKPPREEIPVPLYFDRYVAGELRSLGNQITQVDRRIDELKESMNERFVQVDRRFVELKESVDKRFDKSDANTKWIIGLFSPVIIGILVIIVKMFFGP
jgi:hypothetical protein